MGYLTFYDAAWPPAHPPEVDGVCVYIAGDCVHVWSLAEIEAQPARYRLPVFVRSNPRGIAGVASDVNAALERLRAIGAPRGTLVAFDMEMAAGKLYIAGVYSGLKAAGYQLIVYGSQSSVMENDNPDDLYWGADWTGAAHLHSGDAVTQWVSFAGYDEDEAETGLPFWDTRPVPPKPPVPGPAPKPRPAPVPKERDMIIITTTAPAGHTWEGTESFLYEITSPPAAPVHLVDEADRASVAAQLGVSPAAGSVVSWQQYTEFGGT